MAIAEAESRFSTGPAAGLLRDAITPLDVSAKRIGSLLTAARKGNQEAFARLYDEHNLPLFRFAYRLTGSIADADYPRTAARLCLMWERLETDGFTSYWL